VIDWIDNYSRSGGRNSSEEWKVETPETDIRDSLQNPGWFLLRRPQALERVPLVDLFTGKVNIKPPIARCAAMWIKPESAHDVAFDNSSCMRAINFGASTMGTSAAGTRRSGMRVIGR